MRKVVRYECRTDDCEDYTYEGLQMSDIEIEKTPSDIWLEEED